MDSVLPGTQEAATVLEDEIAEIEALYTLHLRTLDRRGLEAGLARIEVLGRKWPSLLVVSRVVLGDAEGGLPPLIAQGHGRLTEMRRIIDGLGVRASAPEAVEMREAAMLLRSLCACREGEARRAAHAEELVRLRERVERVCSCLDAMEQVKRSAEVGKLTEKEAEHEVNELAARSEEINLAVKGLVSDLDAAHAARCRVRAALEQEVARARSATPAKAATVEDPKASGGEGDSDPAAPDAIEHATDFSWLLVRGERYEFHRPQQRGAIRALWEAREKGGDGAPLGQAAIGETVGSAGNRFRVVDAFRNHRALGTILRSRGRGTYALVLALDPSDAEAT